MQFFLEEHGICESCNLRKGLNGLLALVSQPLREDLLQRASDLHEASLEWHILPKIDAKNLAKDVRDGKVERMKIFKRNLHWGLGAIQDSLRGAATVFDVSGTGVNQTVEIGDFTQDLWALAGDVAVIGEDFESVLRRELPIVLLEANV